MYETTINHKHSHTISDPASGLTDAAEDGHRHTLTTGCTKCDQVRKTLLLGKMLTGFKRGHAHYFEGEILKEVYKNG